jgi:hypothetical protein
MTGCQKNVPWTSTISIKPTAGVSASFVPNEQAVDETAAELPLVLRKSIASSESEQQASVGAALAADNDDTFPSFLAKELEATAFRPKDISQLNAPPPAGS